MISIFLKLNLLTVVVLLGFKSESYRAHFHSLIIVWGKKFHSWLMFISMHQ